MTKVITCDCGKKTAFDDCYNCGRTFPGQGLIPASERKVHSCSGNTTFPLPRLNVVTEPIRTERNPPVPKIKNKRRIDIVRRIP